MATAPSWGSIRRRRLAQRCFASLMSPCWGRTWAGFAGRLVISGPCTLAGGRDGMATSVKLPADDVGARKQRRDGIRGGRYGEIFLIGSDAATGRLVGGVYNTTGLNDPIGTGDSCPQELWDRIDAQ